jgi:hypothetical protein
MKRITAMEQEAREARKAVMRSIRERWTPKEILAAKYAADARTLTEAF